MTRSICILTLALSACDVEDDCSRAAAFPAEMTVGVGEDSFSALQDGDNLDLAHGNQGGTHVWMGVQTTGIPTGETRLFGEATPGPLVNLYLSHEGVELGHGSNYSRPLEGDEEQAEYTGIQLELYWLDESEPSTVDWRAVTLTAELEDQCGTALKAEALVSVDRYAN